MNDYFLMFLQVSGGAEVISISKRFFRQHAGVMTLLKLESMVSGTLKYIDTWSYDEVLYCLWDATHDCYRVSKLPSYFAQKKKNIRTYAPVNMKIRNVSIVKLLRGIFKDFSVIWTISLCVFQLANKMLNDQLPGRKKIF